jgi:XTP/dITP diphosphohydrolase
MFAIVTDLEFLSTPMRNGYAKSMTPLKVLLATNNPGKRKEFFRLLNGLNLEILVPDDLGLTLDVDETGLTYQANAVLKARAFHTASGLATLADDSGLEVEPLGGKPGIHSARYAPPHADGRPADDADRRQYMLKNLAGKSQPWLAQFRCVIALISPAGELICRSGDCPGQILDHELGRDGFGYDPIFFLPQFGRTMAQLGPEEKDRVSHRGQAVARIRPDLAKLIQQSQGAV